MYPSVDFTDELENQEPENSTVSFETEEVVQDEGGNVQPMRAPSLNSSSKQVIEEKEEAEDYWPETSIAADVDDDEDSHQFHESNDPVLEEKRLSSVSCVSSAPPPREEVLSILQERTLQALEYQLFDRLNNGDFHEVDFFRIS